jgi:hypothetical protein
MRTINMTTGARVPLDGDLLTLLETLYRELTARRELERTFEDTVREIQSAIEQMTDAERRQYLSESLFLSFVSYENERLGAYLKKLAEKGPQMGAKAGAQKGAKKGAKKGAAKKAKQAARKTAPARKRAR